MQGIPPSRGSDIFGKDFPGETGPNKKALFFLEKLHENDEDLQGVINSLRGDYSAEETLSLFMEYHKKWINELSYRIKSLNRDSLTGLYTRQKLEDEKERFTSMIKRGLTLGLIMVDLDDFKNVNDTFGHVAGDKVLSAVGAEVIKSIRKYDLPFRYGGDEFLVVFSNIDSTTLKKLADRIVKKVSDLSIHHNSVRLPVTVSAGVCNSIDGTFKSADDIIDAADKALYKAKKLGKNTTAVYYLP